ncbi:hypothetical protein ACOJIV_02680 [Haloarcula sp. AONF1]
MSIAVYSAIGIRTLLLTKGYLKCIWDASVPPYTVESTVEDQYPITWKKSVVPRNNKLHWFKFWVSVSIVILPPTILLYARWIQWNAESISSVLTDIFASEVLFVFVYLLSAPVTILLPEYTSGMNTASLARTATLAWIPAIPLTLAMLNFNSYVYDIMNEFIFICVDSCFR